MLIFYLTLKLVSLRFAAENQNFDNQMCLTVRSLDSPIYFTEPPTLILDSRFQDCGYLRSGLSMENFSFLRRTATKIGTS